MNINRPIRSFIKRHRKLAPNKQKIFDEQWLIYGLNPEKPLKNAFANNQPLVLEIGFGMGVTILNSAKKYPEQNFIGVEVHQPGIATLFSQLQEQQLNNLRVYKEDAVNVLQQCIENNSLEKVLIFFPDPWPKKRHNKRRLIQPEFVELLQKKLKPNGILHVATDWEDYTNHITTVLKNNPAFSTLDTQLSLPIIEDRASTKFEQRGKNKGHEIFDLVFEKTS